MTVDEAATILGPEVCAQLRDLAQTAPPLTDAQRKLLKALYATPDHDRAEVPDVA